MRGIANPLATGPFSITIPDTAGFVGIPNSASGSSLSDDLLPWLIGVDVFQTSVSNVNWATNTAAIDTIYNAVNSSSGAQNDEIAFLVVLAKGTWTFELIYRTNTANGIFSVRFDGVEKGTIDSYAADTYHVRTQITGIAVASTGVVTLKLVMATKNGSASNYKGEIQHIQLKRTA